MALTAEESRALAYNAKLKRRALACKARKARLKGNPAAVSNLIDKTEALTREGIKNAGTRRIEQIQRNAGPDYTGNDGEDC
jgi:hypothetical protein